MSLPLSLTHSISHLFLSLSHTHSHLFLHPFIYHSVSLPSFYHSIHSSSLLSSFIVLSLIPPLLSFSFHFIILSIIHPLSLLSFPFIVLFLISLLSSLSFLPTLPPYSFVYILYNFHILFPFVSRMNGNFDAPFTCRKCMKDSTKGSQFHEILLFLGSCEYCKSFSPLSKNFLIVFSLSLFPAPPKSFHFFSGILLKLFPNFFLL